MNINLTAKLERFVKSKVSSGLYNNASEVMREAVRVLMDRDDERQQKRDRLRRLIQEGRNAIASGRSTAFESDRDIDAFFRKL